MPANLFETPDFEKCEKKRRCCDGENKGLVYTVSKPCKDGFTFDFKKCDCAPEGYGTLRYSHGATLCSSGGGYWCHPQYADRPVPVGGCSSDLTFTTDVRNIKFNQFVIGVGQSSSGCFGKSCTESIPTYFCPVGIDLIDSDGERKVRCATNVRQDGFICYPSNQLQDYLGGVDSCVTAYITDVQWQPNNDGPFYDLGYSFIGKCTPGGERIMGAEGTS